jgi:hypothetical protein
MSEAVVIVAAPDETPLTTDDGQLETVSEAAVDIAEIEAERDVAIAEVQAETAETAIEAQAEQTEVMDAWRSELETQRAALSACENRLMAMEQQIASLTETATAQASAIMLLTPVTPSEGEAPPEENPDGPRENGADRETAARRKRVWM